GDILTPLVVRVEDQFGNPVAGVPVTGQIIQGEAVFVARPSVLASSEDIGNPAVIASVTGQAFLQGAASSLAPPGDSDPNIRTEMSGDNGEARFLVQVISTVSQATVQITAPQVAKPVLLLLNVPVAVAVADL